MRPKKQNKYFKEPDLILDFHGMTTSECKLVLEEIIEEAKYNHVRIIVGKGTKSALWPVLPYFVKNFLDDHNIDYTQSKIQDGGEGALEVFF
jgi:DNA-nicking Smr family endonuclease